MQMIHCWLAMVREDRVIPTLISFTIVQSYKLGLPTYFQH